MGMSVVAGVRKCNRGRGAPGLPFCGPPGYCERVHKRHPAIVSEDNSMRLIALTSLLALGAVACGGGSKPDASQAAEIGRASCREGVGMWGGCGCLTKERRAYVERSEQSG